MLEADRRRQEHLRAQELSASGGKPSPPGGVSGGEGSRPSSTHPRDDRPPSHGRQSVGSAHPATPNPAQDRDRDRKSGGPPPHHAPPPHPGGDKASPSPSTSKPPALIPDKERARLREMESRDHGVDTSLKEKQRQSETHQILKEDLELKRQMEERQRLLGQGIAVVPPGHPGYNPELHARHREDLEKYYMYQRQRALEERARFPPDAAAAHPRDLSRDAHAQKPGAGQPDVLSPREREVSDVHNSS